ncbi:MAG: CTP pyrophosphohydrolase [Candidatus Heimdallarchaeota archaeon LC_2]|nr:MAG: CTP pyrophosphohydrolase [Candidatus Heimdallarchaeota archaeon LC_2]
MVGTFLVGVSIILVKNQKVLIAKRAKNQFAPGLWEFPSGRLEEGEDPFEGLLREAKEELDILVKPIQIIDAYTFKRNSEDLILLNIFCDFVGEEKISSEHDEIRWVEMSEARQYFSFPQQQKTLDKFIEYLQIYNSRK